MFVIFTFELHHAHSNVLLHCDQYFCSFERIHDIGSNSSDTQWNVKVWFMWVLFLQSASKTVVVGSQVWVEDPEIAWKAGEVEAVKGGEITVKCTSGDTVSKTLITVSQEVPTEKWNLDIVERKRNPQCHQLYDHEW